MQSLAIESVGRYAPPMTPQMRNLVVIRRSQLSLDADAFDPAQDAARMTEAREKVTFTRQHACRPLYFFSAMRHFMTALEARGVNRVRRSAELRVEH